MWPKINEEMTIRELLTGGNKVTELRNSGIVSLAVNCKWENKGATQKRSKKGNYD
jgi:hypothetical protein